MTPPSRSVWIDVQGCQNVENFERGIARQAADSTEALLRIAPEIVHTIGLTPALSDANGRVAAALEGVLPMPDPATR